MTDRSKLLALAEAVEKLTGPDREVDAEIAARLRIGTEHPWALNYPAWIATANGRVHLEKNGPSFASPLYTASLDAAMTLVPGDMAFLLDWGHYSSDPKGVLFWEAYVQFKDDAVNRGDAEAASPALALTAACLRARAQAEALA